MSDQAQFMVPDGTGNVTTTIRNCARCEGTHADLVFTPLKGEPIGGEGYTHWALCPSTGQPIVMKVMDPSAAKFAEMWWTPNDVTNIRPDWSHEECAKFLSTMETNIRDRITELGWEVLETLALVYKENK